MKRIKRHFEILAAGIIAFLASGSVLAGAACPANLTAAQTTQCIEVTANGGLSWAEYNADVHAFLQAEMDHNAAELKRAQETPAFAPSGRGHPLLNTAHVTSTHRRVRPSS